MTGRPLLLCVVVLVGACVDRSPSPPTQPAVTPPPPAPPAPRPIPGPPVCCETIEPGQEVKGTFIGRQLAYALTPTRDGTLVATISWDPFSTDSLLNLQIESTEFKGVPPRWSPVTGQLPVVAGRQYVIAVNPGGTGWFYDNPFVLTTTIQ